MNNNTNKVLVDLIVPDIEETYSVFLPVNVRIGHIILLLNKSIREMTNNNDLFIDNNNCLYHQEKGNYYKPELIIK